MQNFFQIIALEVQRLLFGKKTPVKKTSPAKNSADKIAPVQENIANKKPAEAGFLPSHPWEFL